MPTLSLDQLKNIKITKNVRKSSDNAYEASKTLIPHADAVSLVTVISDYLYYFPLAQTISFSLDASTLSLTTANTIVIPAANSTTAGVMSADHVKLINDLITLTGVGPNATHLGTFTGSIIPPSSTIKQALQALSDAFAAGGDGNGIYSSSGTIHPNCQASLPNNSFFYITYPNASTGIGISSSFNQAFISSSSGHNVVWVNNSQSAIQSEHLTFTLAGVATFTDSTVSPKGIQYAANYHSTYTNRSLVDKEYVDSKILPPPASVGSILVSVDGVTWSQVNEWTYTLTSHNSSVVNLPHTPIASPKLKVYVNGVLKTTPEDYSVSTNTVTFALPILPTDKLTFIYFA